MKNQKVKISIAAMIIIILSIIIIFIQTSPAKDNQLDSKTILKVISLLRNEYFHEVNTNQMLNGAISGINDYMKKKFSLKHNFLREIPEKEDNLEAINHFKGEYSRLMEEYGNKIDKDDLIYTALNKMFGILNNPPYDDPYTSAMTPKEYRILTEQMTGGNFAGIGVYIQLDKKNNNQLTVVEPIEYTPAYKAGLKGGDQIIKIDGLATAGIDIDVAVNKIRGPVGSKVVLTIKRPKENNITKDIPIIREQIHVSSAVPKLLNKKIGYIKLRMFAKDTNKELRDSLEELLKKDVKAIVLDLRNNGGGYINSAAEVCSQLLPKGTLIVSVVNYRKHTREPYRSYNYEYTKLPLVVLINQYSASASEIVAGALQDTQRAFIVGETSFGKGSVQSIYPLTNNGAIKYTIALYLTPEGKNINKKGIIPDCETKMDVDLIGTKDDMQLKKAVEIIQQKYI